MRLPSNRASFRAVRSSADRSTPSFRSTAARKKGNNNINLAQSLKQHANQSLEGFPPKLAGGSLRGNLGLMDQVAALHWIRDNIEAFGGSPDNITLMGTKRAAIAINLLMLSPLAKGKF